MYLMQEGIYRDYDARGRLIEEVKEALPALKFPMTLWLEPQAPHAVHNLHSKPTPLRRIELKRYPRPTVRFPTATVVDPKSTLPLQY